METKVCSAGCSLTPQPISNFNFRNRALRTRHSYCRECGKKKTKAHYANNPQYYKDKARQFDKVAVPRNQEFVFCYLSVHPCVDCGECDPIVLEFDHVRGKKKRNIGNMVKNGDSIRAIEKEIEKCDVRCANCHRRITSKRAGHFRSLRALSSIA